MATLALSTLARQRVLQARLAQRAEALATGRTARHLITRELRAGGPGEVPWRLPSDSLPLRAYRGIAVVCEGLPTGREVRVAYRGVRRPDAGKDSVWVLGAGGDVRVLSLVSADSDVLACGPSGLTLARWVLSGQVPDRAVLALYFERGSMHLSEGALRYRRGEGGRQPLTPESLLTPPSAFEAWGDGVAAHLVTAGSAWGAGRVVAPSARGDGDGGG